MSRERTISFHGAGGDSEAMRQCMELLPVACLTLDLEGRLLQVNQAFRDLAGLPGQHGLGGTLAQFLVPHQADQFREWLADLTHADRLPSQVLQLCRKDGAVLTVRLEAQASTHGDRRLLHATLHNITAYTRAAEALQQDETELAVIYVNAPLIMSLLDETGRLRRVNQAAVDFLGRPMEDLIGRLVGDLIGCAQLSPDRPCCAESSCGVGCTLLQTVRSTLQAGQSCHRVAARVCLRRGPQTISSNLLVSTARVNVGPRSMVLLCLEDVTEQLRSEEQLREQAALLDITQDAICVLDLEGRVLFWNRGAEALYGWKASEALGHDVRTLIFETVPPEWEESTLRILQQGYWTGEIEQCNRAHEPRVVQSRGSLVRTPAGEAKAILLVGTDQTEQKELEKQFRRSQRLESIGTLASGVAHDLNNVLTPICLAGELLRTMIREPNAGMLLDTLQRSASRGTEIIKQLLVFGHGIDGDRTALNLRYLVKELSKIVQETFPKSIWLQTAVDPALWAIVGNVTQIHQVLLNLCVNARDAMPHGGRLTIEAKNHPLEAAQLKDQPAAKPGPYLALSVTDTGTGIPANILDKIFDPFFTTKATGHGSGLGLFTVQGIVKNHGGFVRIATQVGHGTTFRVFLPATLAEVAPDTAAPPPTVLSSQGEMLLVVDDEDHIRRMMKRLLENQGFRVLTSGDGGEAVSVYGHYQAEIALVITDMMMPFMDGTALIQALRKINPLVPIIAISGLASQRAEAELAGGPQLLFLPKPFSRSELNDRIRTALASRRQPLPWGG